LQRNPGKPKTGNRVGDSSNLNLLATFQAVNVVITMQKIRNIGQPMSRAACRTIKGGVGDSSTPGSSGTGLVVCVSCIDTPGYWNQHGNMMCKSVPPGYTCIPSYGSMNGIACGNANITDFNFVSCPVV
jgi:hypothetical protein